MKQLSARHQAVLATFLGFRKPLYSCTAVQKEFATPPRIHPMSRTLGTSLLMIRFTRPSSTSALQATNAGVRRLADFRMMPHGLRYSPHGYFSGLWLSPTYSLLQLMHMYVTSHTANRFCSESNSYINNLWCFSFSVCSASMGTIYAENKDEDGFLYVAYSGENTFGLWHACTDNIICSHHRS